MKCSCTLSEEPTLSFYFEYLATGCLLLKKKNKYTSVKKTKQVLLKVNHLSWEGILEVTKVLFLIMKKAENKDVHQHNSSVKFGNFHFVCSLTIDSQQVLVYLSNEKEKSYHYSNMNLLSLVFAFCTWPNIPLI